MVGGPQFHAEDRGRPGLRVRRGQQLDGLVVAALAIGHETQAHQRVGLDPGRVAVAGGGDAALGPVPGHGVIALDQQGVGVGGEGPRVLPGRRVRGRGLDRGPGHLDRLGVGLGIFEQQQVERQPLADPAGQHDVARAAVPAAAGIEQVPQPAQQVDRALHVAAVGRVGRGPQAELGRGPCPPPGPARSPGPTRPAPGRSGGAPQPARLAAPLPPRPGSMRRTRRGCRGWPGSAGPAPRLCRAARAAARRRAASSSWRAAWSAPPAAGPRRRLRGAGRAGRRSPPSRRPPAAGG